MLYGSAADQPDQTEFTQPALFALQYALATLWQSWGVGPTVALGHSVGEYAAACVAGVISLAQGLELISARGRFMGELPAAGAMAAILAPEPSVRARLTTGVSIAAINGPEQTVISGAIAEVESICAAFQAAGTPVKRLRVSHAFHSVLMEPIAESFGQLAATIDFQSPRLRLISSVTGRAATLAELSQASYWRRQVREPVQFHEAAKQLAGCELFVEIGPGSTLLGLGQAVIGGPGQVWVPSIRRSKPDGRQMAESLAELYARGVDVDWARYHQGRGCRRIGLPTYPFQRRRYWIEDHPALADRRPSQGHPLLGERIDVAGGTSLWQTQLSIATYPWIADLRVHQETFLPMTVYLEMMAAAAECHLADIVLLEPLAMVQDPVSVQIIAKEAKLEFYSRQDDSWTLHASAQRTPAQPQTAAPLPDTTAPTFDGLHLLGSESCPAPGSARLDVHEFYEDLKQRGRELNPALRLIESLHRGKNTAVARIRCLPAIGFPMHPACLDAGVLVLTAAMPPGTESHSVVGIEHFMVSQAASDRVWAHARLIDQNSDAIQAEITIFDDTGMLLAQLQGLELRPHGRTGKVIETVRKPQTGPNLRSIAAAVRKHVAAVCLEQDVPAARRLALEVDRLSTAAIVNVLPPLTVGRRYRTLDLAQTCGVVEHQRRLFTRLLEILVEDGLLRREGDEWICTEAVPRGPLDYQPVFRCFPSFELQITLHQRCAENLAKLLRAEVEPLELLFPDAERLYRESPENRAASVLLAEAVRSLLAAQLGARPRNRSGHRRLNRSSAAALFAGIY